MTISNEVKVLYNQLLNCSAACNISQCQCYHDNDQSLISQFPELLCFLVTYITNVILCYKRHCCYMPKTRMRCKNSKSESDAKNN